MLQRLYVDNFRCLVNFEFKPERVNLILGRNGSGKSTLLDALQCVLRLVAGASPQSVLTLDSLAWWDVRRLQTFEVEFTDAGSTYHYRLVIRHSDREPAVVHEERLRFGSSTLVDFSEGMLQLGSMKGIPFDGKQSVLALGLGRDRLVDRFLSLAFGVLVFRLNPWGFELQAREEQRMLWTSASNLVGYLRAWSQTDPAGYLAWIRIMLESMPHLEDLQLRELVPGSRMLVGVKHVEGREILLSLANFSDGERALCALYAIAGMSSADPRCIGLDEPDNFLAPSEVQPVLRRFTIDAPKEPGPQLFVITHHPESIDYLASYATWLFERGEDGLSRVRRLEFDRTRGERPTDTLLSEIGV